MNFKIVQATIVAISGLSLFGCNDTGFRPRVSMLSSQMNSLNGAGTNGDVPAGTSGSGSNPTDGSAPIPAPTPAAGGNGSNPLDSSAPVAGSSTLIPLQNLCSDQRTAAAGSNVMSALSLEMIIKDSSGAIVCDVTAGVKDGIINQHGLDLTLCPPLTAASYTVTLVDPGKLSKDLFYPTISPDFAPAASITITRTSAGGYVATQAKSKDGQSGLFVLYDVKNNPNDSACTLKASPLMIDVANEAIPDANFVLTSPANGVMFDILGANSNPAPHAKKQISWVENPRKFMFLVLPKNGQVNGIDEMFGNNTLGPDGKFAANGFDALSKYVVNGSGSIDASIPIFSQLRVWSDRNRDGIAQPSELMPLAKVGISAINLKYDPVFEQIDEDGNELRYFSTVTQHGKARSIFDVWFVIGQ